MEPTLKLIKNELKPLVKSENLKLSHLNNAFQEVLEYSDYFTLNRRKHFLTFAFILQKPEKSLTFKYHYVYNSKVMTVDETYSSGVKELEFLPGVNPIDKARLNELYKYEVIDNVITNTVPLEEQYKVIMEVFRNNQKTIIEHAKNIANIKKIPE